MQMNSKILLLARNKLKKYISDREILDVILFGSAVKGKASPSDIDVAIITEKNIKENIDNFHISFLKSSDFFKQYSIIHTLLREGYSLKNKMPFSEVYKFQSRALFIYELKELSPSEKVRIVNILRGKNGNKGNKGMVVENNGKWLANQVFIIPVENENIFEKFFLNF